MGAPALVPTPFHWNNSENGKKVWTYEAVQFHRTVSSAQTGKDNTKDNIIIAQPESVREWKGVRSIMTQKKSFWLGDNEFYSSTAASLKGSVKKTKQRYQQILETGNTSNGKEMWQEYHCETMWHDELNTSLALIFLNMRSAVKSTVPTEDQPEFRDLWENPPKPSADIVTGILTLLLLQDSSHELHLFTPYTTVRWWPHFSATSLRLGSSDAVTLSFPHFLVDRRLKDNG